MGELPEPHDLDRDPVVQPGPLRPRHDRVGACPGQLLRTSTSSSTGARRTGGEEIIEEFASELTWWRSAPDEGQYAAIDDGFRRTTGDVMGWINSDDLYMPWTLAVVKDIFHQLPEVEWLTTLRPLTADVSGNIVRCEYTGGSTRRGRSLPG